MAPSRGPSDLLEIPSVLTHTSVSMPCIPTLRAYIPPFAPASKPTVVPSTSYATITARNTASLARPTGLSDSGIPHWERRSNAIEGTGMKCSHWICSFLHLPPPLSTARGIQGDRTLTPYSSSHDNAKFASCGGDKVVFVWDVASGTVLRRLQGHFGKINTVVFNRDAQVLASGESCRALLDLILCRPMLMV